MPPVAIAAVGVAAVAGGAIAAKAGADRQADAMESAGNAQAAAARAETREATRRLEREIAERRRIEERAVEAASRTPNEIAALNRVIRLRDEAYSRQTAELNKQFEILDAADPGIKEAGSQLLGLMRGESTKMLEPVMRERSQQKAKLEAQLRRTLGPGFRTTSAGMEALNRFDEGTESVLFSTQDAAINRALSVYTGGLNARGNTLATAQNAYSNINALDQTVLSTESGIANRQTGAIIQAPAAAPVNFGAIQEAKRNETATAAAPFAGEIARGQATSQLGGTFMGMGTSLLTMGVGGAMGGGNYGTIAGSGGGSGMSVGQISNELSNTKPLTYNSQYFGQLGG